MALTDALKTLLSETAKALQGSARRLCMARAVTALGPGGQQRAARALRWGRMTLRPGIHALASGMRCIAALTRRGRTRAAAPLPPLLTARQARVESPSPAPPQCRPPRLAPRLTAAEVRGPLSAPQGDADATLPTAATSGTTWHAWGYSPQQVAQRQPPTPCRKPTRSAPTAPSALRQLRRRTRGDAARARPRRPCQAGRVRGGARAASRPWRLLPPCTPRRRGLLWASACRPGMHWVSLGAPPP